MEVIMNKNIKYRDLVDGDKIQIGDEWYNPDWEWEVVAPWFKVRERSLDVGERYDSKIRRPMRRPLDT